MSHCKWRKRQFESSQSLQTETHLKKSDWNRIHIQMLLRGDLTVIQQLYIKISVIFYRRHPVTNHRLLGHCCVGGQFSRNSPINRPVTVPVIKYAQSRLLGSIRSQKLRAHDTRGKQLSLLIKLLSTRREDLRHDQMPLLHASTKFHDNLASCFSKRH